jgi:type IV pilus assembly protein PilF
MTLTGCKSTPQPDNNELAPSGHSGPRSKADIAKINVQLGMAYLEQKNVQRAKQKFLLALDQGPNIPETWYSMAYFLEATGNQEEASKYYLKAVEVAPGRGDAQNNYGTFLCRSGRYQESIKHFMLAAKSPEYLDPAAAYENAGMCAMKIPSYQQAEGYFKQALLKDPARTLSLLKLAEVDIKLGNIENAKKMLNQFALVAEPTPESEALHQQIAKKLG